LGQSSPKGEMTC